MLPSTRHSRVFRSWKSVFFGYTYTWFSAHNLCKTVVSSETFHGFLNCYCRMQSVCLILFTILALETSYKTCDRTHHCRSICTTHFHEAGSRKWSINSSSVYRSTQKMLASTSVSLNRNHLSMISRTGLMLLFSILPKAEPSILQYNS